MSELKKKSRFIDLLLFSGNETATTASFNLVSFFFILMMTDNLLLGAIGAGIIFSASRILDAFTDPLIGTLIDKTITKYGRYRPFILIGSVTLNLGILSIFGGFIHFQSDSLMYLWIIIWYIVYIIGYTFQSACTRSAQTIITNDQFQRPLLGALLSSFSYLFYGIFAIVAIPFVNSFPGGYSNPLGYRYLSLVVIGVNLVLTILAVIGLRTMDKKESYTKILDAKKVTLKSMFSLIKRNGPLKALIIAAGTNKFAQLITSTSMVMFFTYTVRDIAAQKVVASWGLLFGIIGVLVGLVVASLFDRKKSFLLGTYMGLLFPIIIIIIRPFSPELEWLFLGLLVAIIFATAVASSNVLPLIADVADYEYYVNKQYIPSVVGTTFSLVDKLMSSLSGVILAAVLTYIGYTAGMDPTSRAFWGFFAMVIIIPALGHLASILAFRFYPITKTFYHQMIIDKDKA